jgi:hypothetical protein
VLTAGCSRSSTCRRPCTCVRSQTSMAGTPAPTCCSRRVNFVSELPAGDGDPLEGARRARHADSGRRVDLVALPGRGAFDLLSASNPSWGGSSRRSVSWITRVRDGIDIRLLWDRRTTPSRSPSTISASGGRCSSPSTRRTPSWTSVTPTHTPSSHCPRPHVRPRDEEARYELMYALARARQNDLLQAATARRRARSAAATEPSRQTPVGRKGLRWQRPSLLVTSPYSRLTASVRPVSGPAAYNRRNGPKQHIGANR